MIHKFILTTLAIFLSTVQAFAEIHAYRWTQVAKMSNDLAPILEKLNAESGLSLTSDNFSIVEDRDLATSHFKHYAQSANGVPIKGAMIRIWSDLNSTGLVQMEAHLDDGQAATARIKALRLKGWPHRSVSEQLSSLDTMKYVSQVVGRHPDDRRVQSVEWQDVWDGSQLQRVIKVKGRRGTHEIVVSHFTHQIVSATYQEYPQVDIPALVYPIYEQTEKENKILDRVLVTLKNILPSRRQANDDPYASLRTRHYFEDMINPILGETPEGQEQGYWSPNWLLKAAKELLSVVPVVDNSFENGGVYLEGQYATINIHPDAMTAFKGIQFTPSYSGQLATLWKPVPGEDGGERWELVPAGAFRGQPLADAASALARVARRLPNHDPVTYMNDGFDEIQVYYAIDRLMESLHQMGFTDPELSTRQFHAFLYDPDIGMRDNAYYTNDTINFTTYSPEAQNFARDNSTIWHELGHGVMDRLMGDYIHLADSGGLSEGMADFVAQLVIQDVTNGMPFPGSDDFRIINGTGFNLTNESHDDGEAYGGTMNDILIYSIGKWGRQGLMKMTDLTLEAMRLTRNHPALTANDWFEHMLFADELGREGVRAPGEMRELITKALLTRNFNLDRSPVTEFKITYVPVANGMKLTGLEEDPSEPSEPTAPSEPTTPSEPTELTSDSVGSRYNPLTHALSEGEEAHYRLHISLKPSPTYLVQYPVKIEIHYTGGALEGALRWVNENEGPLRFTLASPDDSVEVDLGARAGCDFINREDGSCSDYAYIQAINQYGSKPFAKKRFYIRVTSPEPKNLTVETQANRVKNN